LINNVKIERVYENKLLDVILDAKICWKPQNKNSAEYWSNGENKARIE